LSAQIIAIIISPLCKVNAVSTVNRNVAAIKAQFTDLKSRTKKKARNLLKETSATGGGELDLSILTMDEIDIKVASLEKFERALVKLIGKEGLAGIDGGLETNLPNVEHPDSDEGLDGSQAVYLVDSTPEPSSSNAVQVWRLEVIIITKCMKIFQM